MKIRYKFQNSKNFEYIQSLMINEFMFIKYKLMHILRIIKLL
jgi:hypothetical protein